nr:hypothetical protein BaRGS_016291 [Batillaria attramentaria]
MLEKGVDFELVETDPYNKTPEFLALNPRGLVPTLIHNGRSVYESLVINEYIEDAWPQEPKLLPADPFSRAQARIWIDFIAKQLMPQYYHILQQQDKDKQEEAKSRLIKRLGSITAAMSSEGPYFFGEKFGLVDITLLPLCLRFPILEHFRQFSLPADGSFERLQTWLNACKSRPCVSATMAPEDKLIAKYQRYADDTAQTQVAEAIRKGTALP